MGNTALPSSSTSFRRPTPPIPRGYWGGLIRVHINIKNKSNIRREIFNKKIYKLTVPESIYFGCYRAIIVVVLANEIIYFVVGPALRNKRTILKAQDTETSQIRTEFRIRETHRLYLFKCCRVGALAALCCGGSKYNILVSVH